MTIPQTTPTPEQMAEFEKEFGKNPLGNTIEAYNYWRMRLKAFTLGITLMAKEVEAARDVQAREVAMALKNAAWDCEKRAEERFAEYGTCEWDTRATYYTGADAEEHEARDEEDRDCAEAIMKRREAIIAARPGAFEKE